MKVCTLMFLQQLLKMQLPDQIPRYLVSLFFETMYTSQCLHRRQSRF
uniref:Uncharacterized protein n=1 Tax=Arundo donax TaxID=35708 RepID=A0A0A9GNC2_ARUDO